MMKPFIYNSLERNCWKVSENWSHWWTITNDGIGMWRTTEFGNKADIKHSQLPNLEIGWFGKISWQKFLFAKIGNLESSTEFSAEF